MRGLILQAKLATIVTFFLGLLGSPDSYTEPSQTAKIERFVKL